MARENETERQLKCSFCGKSQRHVRKLIAGPGVYICDECIELCNDIVEDELAEETPSRSSRPAHAAGDLRAAQRATSSARTRPRRSSRSRSTTTTSACISAVPASDDDVELAKSNILLLGPDRLRQDAARADARAHPQGAVRHRRRHRAHRGRLRGRGRREHPAQAHHRRRLRRRSAPRSASSTSTRSTRSRARPRTSRSRATCRARACSRRCSRSSRAPRPPCRRRAGASTRSRSSSASTRPTCCSSSAARSSASRRSSPTGWARRASASAPSSPTRPSTTPGVLLAQVLPEDLHQFGLIPEFVGRLPVIDARRGAHRGRPGPHPHRAEERARQAVPAPVRARGRRARRSPTTRCARSPTRRIKRGTGARGLRSILERCCSTRCTTCRARPTSSKSSSPRRPPRATAPPTVVAEARPRARQA